MSAREGGRDGREGGKIASGREGEGRGGEKRENEQETSIAKFEVTLNIQLQQLITSF